MINNNKLLIIIVLVVLLLMGFCLLLIRQENVSATTLAVVTLKYANWTNQSRMGPDSWRRDTFWVTNHSDKVVAISLREVEILTNGVWSSYASVPLPGLLFFTNMNSREARLSPHAAGFGSLLAQSLTLPTNAPWRVKASVVEKLQGIEDVTAAIERQPKLIEARLKTGDTNIPLNPFRKDVSRMGHPSEVVSEGVNSP